MCLPSGLFPSGFPTKILYALKLHHMHATCHAHLFFALIFPIIFGSTED
jgi:hypothetical protein